MTMCIEGTDSMIPSGISSFLSDAQAFDATLRIGMVVMVQWKKGPVSCKGRAEVVKLNKKSIDVRLLDDVVGRGTMMQARDTIRKAPRYDGNTWGPYNRVQAIE